MSLQIKALTSIAIIVVTQLIVFLSELKINKKDPVYMEVNRRRNIFKENKGTCQKGTGYSSASLSHTSPKDLFERM